MDGSPARSSELQVERSAADGADAAAWVGAGALGHIDAEGAAWVGRRGRAISATLGRQQRATAASLRLSGSDGQRASGRLHHRPPALLRQAERASCEPGPREAKPGHFDPSGSASLESGAVEATLLVGDVVGVLRVAGVHVRRVAHLRGACHSTTTTTSKYSA